MNALTDAPLQTLTTWHHEQSPLVQALAAPMVDELAGMLGRLQQVFDAHQARVEGLEAVVVQLGTEREQERSVLQAALVEVNDMTAKFNATAQRIDVLERTLFGQKSERRREKTPDPRKAARQRKRDTLTKEEKEERRQAAAAKRQARLEALPATEYTVPLPASLDLARHLPPLTSTVYEWKPGHLVRVRVAREQAVLSDGCIVTAPPVDQVVEGGSYGPALYAKVVVDKCLMSLPLRRQERAFDRVGAPLPVSTLCALFHRASEVTGPLYDALQASIGSAPHLHADETPLPVLDEDTCHKGWMWVFATADAVLFRYAATRGKATPEAVLGGSTGTLVVDGYTAYHSVTGETGRTRGGCWCHARRGLYDARKLDEPVVNAFLDDIGVLFDVEEEARDEGILGTPAHLALRTARSAPVIERLFASLQAYSDAAVDERSALVTAVRYLLNQREPLQLFLRDSAVPIHNNDAERALRTVALLRKNALFAGSDEAAQRFAKLLSLLATCQIHDVNPEDWLADVLIAVGVPGITAMDLLPWNWKKTRGTSYRPLFDLT